MKRIICIFLVLILIIALEGCGKDSTNKGKNQVSTKDTKQDVKDIEIKDYGWYDSNGHLKYYIVLHNPNENVAIDLPSYRVTARDSNDAVLGTEDHTISMIYPGQDFYYAKLGFSVDETPASVSFETLPLKDYKIKDISTIKEYIPLEVINITENEKKYTGEISNPNDYDINMAIVVCICKDSKGNLVYEDTTFVDSIKAKGSAPFEIKVLGEDDAASVEIYAYPWS